MADLNRRSVIRATATIVGMIIGAGIFGVPYAFLRSGVIVGTILTLGVGAIFTIYHLLYGEINLRTRERHRLVGFAGIYLGRWGKRLVAFTNIGSFYGGLLAYMILGGLFLHVLVEPMLPGVSPTAMQVLFYAAGALAVLAGLKIIARLEVAFTALLILAVFLVLGVGAAEVWVENFRQAFFGEEFLLSYGVILFALGGATAVPEMRDVLKGRERRLAPTIIIGTAIAVILTLAFGLVVLGVSGPFTSEEAILGLAPYLGRSILYLGSAMGLLAVATSFFVIGINLREVFEFDYRLGRVPAWVLAMGVPFLLFVAGAQSFIYVISVTGAVFIGIETIVISALAIAARRRGGRKPEYVVPVPGWAIVAMASIFVVGIVAELARLVS